MNLIGKQAPNFKASAVMPDNSISDNFDLMEYKGSGMAVLFFYPLDFTFVCPSEIVAFNNRLEQFKKLNTKVIGISVDSQFTHLAWKNTPLNKGGIGDIGFPLVADLTKNIAKSYDVLFNDAISLRATFLIDKVGNIRQQSINDLPLGRNVDEMLRLVEALIFHETHGEVCPAGWQKDKKGMKATKAGVAQYLEENATSL